MITGIVNLWNRWGLKAGLSVADQGAVSGANFILNILLARWISPAEYGAFAIAFSIFIFFASFHNALIGEPMSVLGPARHRDHLSKYLGNLIWIHMGLSIVLGLILAGVALALKIINSYVAISLLGLSFATPFILLFWLLRRSCYVNTRPDLALKGSFLYAIFLIAGLFLFQRRGLLSPLSAFFLMALASLATSMFLWSFIGLKINLFAWLKTNPGIPVILKEHWSYGRWAVSSRFVWGLKGTIYMSLIGVFAGLAQTGAYRAMWNLVRPIEQTLVALGLLLLPWISRQGAVQGKGYVKKIIPKISIMHLSLAGSYVFFLLLFGKWMVEFLYGKGYYENFLWLLPFFGLTVLIASIFNAIGVIVRALERPDLIFWSQSGGAILAFTLGIYLLWKLGIYGAAVYSVLGILTQLCILIYCVKKL